MSYSKLHKCPVCHEHKPKTKAFWYSIGDHSGSHSYHYKSCRSCITKKEKEVTEKVFKEVEALTRYHCEGKRYAT